MRSVGTVGGDQLAEDSPPVLFIIILNEQHLRAVLTDSVRSYNTNRPHRSLQLDTPRRAVRPAAGSIHSRPVLGGLHHVYARAG
jgi:hypothetical protein